MVAICLCKKIKKQSNKTVQIYNWIFFAFEVIKCFSS